MNSIKVRNAKAFIEITNLKLCENDFYRVTFDIEINDEKNVYKTNFSEMYVDRLRLNDNKIIVDENHVEKRLFIGKKEISLEIISNPDELSDFELKFVYN